MRSQMNNSILAQQYYEQVALESGDYYMLELATTCMPTKRRFRTRVANQKSSSPTMSSLQERLELMQERVAQLKKQAMA